MQRRDIFFRFIIFESVLKARLNNTPISQGENILNNIVLDKEWFTAVINFIEDLTLMAMNILHLASSLKKEHLFRVLKAVKIRVP